MKSARRVVGGGVTTTPFDSATSPTRGAATREIGANIGVVADAPAFAWFRLHLTAEAVADYFQTLETGAVTRYELPKILAFNFVIEAALGGGASRSLRIDSQGKAWASSCWNFASPR